MKFINVPKAIVPFLHYNGFVLISITVALEELPKIPEECIDVLPLKFEDTNGKGDDRVYFSREHAKKILEFYHKYKNKTKHFVVHCAAGMSRSAGVTAALYRIHFNEDNEKYWTEYLPNTLVYRTIIREHCGATDNEIV